MCSMSADVMLILQWTVLSRVTLNAAHPWSVVPSSHPQLVFCALGAAHESKWMVEGQGPQQPIIAQNCCGGAPYGQWADIWAARTFGGDIRTLGIERQGQNMYSDTLTTNTEGGRSEAVSMSGSEQISSYEPVWHRNRSSMSSEWANSRTSLGSPRDWQVQDLPTPGSLMLSVQQCLLCWDSLWWSSWQGPHMKTPHPFLSNTLTQCGGTVKGCIPIPHVILSAFVEWLYGVMLRCLRLRYAGGQQRRRLFRAAK